MEAGMMKNMAEIFLMRAGFSNKLILYTLRRIVRAELSCAELSAPNCPAPNCPDTDNDDDGRFISFYATQVAR